MTSRGIGRRSLRRPRTAEQVAKLRRASASFVGSVYRDEVLVALRQGMCVDEATRCKAQDLSGKARDRDIQPRSVIMVMVLLALLVKRCASFRGLPSWLSVQVGGRLVAGLVMVSPTNGREAEQQPSSNCYPVGKAEKSSTLLAASSSW